MGSWRCVSVTSLRRNDTLTINRKSLSYMKKYLSKTGFRAGRIISYCTMRTGFSKQWRFDNGDNRNYNNTGPHSRAVEYEIDSDNKTIKLVWSYGKERGEDTYARIVSKVSYLDSSNSVLFTPGSSLNAGIPSGKVVEVDYTSSNVIFEATIRPPNAIFNISFHNVLRVNLF